MIDYRSIDLSYDDILVSPAERALGSRLKCNPFLDAGYNALPVVVAPMSDLVVDSTPSNRDCFLRTVIGLLEEGETGIPYVSFTERDLFWSSAVYNRILEYIPTYNVGIAVSLVHIKKSATLTAQRLIRVVNHTENASNIIRRDYPVHFLIDVANGASPSYIDSVVEFTKLIKDEIQDKRIAIWIGNYANPNTLFNYQEDGLLENIHSIRYGIGGGSACLTRINTGIGRGTVSGLLELTYNNEIVPNVVADGGIKNTGDIVKSLVCGADFAMAGKLFARAQESHLPGDFNGNKMYYGLASRCYQERLGRTENFSPEGTQGFISKKDIQPLERILRDMEWNLRSAMGYLGITELSQFKECKHLLRRTTSSTVIESRSHI